MYYYLGYFFIALMGGVRLVRKGHSAHPFLLLFFCATVLVFGFRYGVGTDYHSYISIYEDIAGGRGFHQQRLESGYYWANHGLAQLGLPSQSIIFAAFLVTFSFVILTLKRYSQNLFVSILVLVCFGLLFKSTNLVRQGLAFSVCLLAIPYIFKRDFLRFLLVVVVAAFLFHRTALFFIGTYFLIAFPRNQLLWFALFVLAVVIKMYNRQLIALIAASLSGLDFVYAGYFEDMQQLHRSSVGMGVNLLLELGLFFFLVASLPRLRDDEKSRLFLSIYMIGILMNFAFSESAMLNRIAFYYYEFAFLALPVLAQSINPGRGRAMFYGIFVAYCMLLYAIVAFSADSSYRDYRNVLFDLGTNSSVY